MLWQQSQKMRFAGTTGYLQIFKTGYFFHRSIAITINETTVYDFISPNKSCQRHLETRSANV